jgi:hypothetical protein
MGQERPICGGRVMSAFLKSETSVATIVWHYRRLLDAFEKAPASIAAIAISIATCADFTSTPVTNLASVRRFVIAIMAFPSARTTLARHFPGSRSNARTTNCLYSMANNSDYRNGISTSDRGRAMRCP